MDKVNQIYELHIGAYMICDNPNLYVVKLRLWKRINDNFSQCDKTQDID